MGSEGTRHRGVRLPLVHSSPTVACLSLLLLFIAVSSSLVQCQRQTPTEVSPPVNSSSLLLCSQCSNGEPLGSLVVKSPRSDCASGHYHAVPSVTDHCHCDLVCARESRQACRLSLPSLDLRITNQTLCDESLSLRCNEATNLCEGPLLLSITHIRHQSFFVNWVGDDSSQIPAAQSSPAAISLAPYSSTNVSDANFTLIKPYITKSEPNRLSAKVDGLKENTTYLVKVSDSGKHELAIVRTSGKAVDEWAMGPLTNLAFQENTLVETLPKVLVTARNISSLSIAFDDFKLPNYQLGYAFKYRTIAEDGAIGDQNWTVVSSNSSRPFYVLSNLMPSTQYQIQVFTWEKFGERVKTTSEVVNASTMDGCRSDNQTFAVGEMAIADCDQMCRCQSGGSLACTERCHPPFVSFISANKSVDCSPHPTDSCCFRCPKEASSNSKKFIDKPGECAAVSSKNSTSCVPKNAQSECSHDYHCTGIKKCCPNSCSGLSCQAPANSSLESKCPFNCGPNAKCIYSDEDSIHKCVCLDGYTSEEPIRGCRLKTNRLHQCTFEAKQYNIGQSFEHSCQLCTCSEALEVECKSKCRPHNQTVEVGGQNCKEVPDPSDPDCCKVMSCATTHNETEHHFHHNPLHNDSSSLLRPGGCEHHGTVFQVNETFNMDCEIKCLCAANGAISCSPRCYVDPGFDERFCYYVEDPDDPECCKIAICDHNSTQSQPLPTLDVIIEMAEAINSTSLRIRLLNTTFRNGTIFYSKIMPNETDKDNSLRAFIQKNLTNSDFAIVSDKSVEVILGQLDSETDYLIHYKEANFTSNQVFVRTYPKGINHTFKGCFHGSQIIQVGELFYEGECEYKCICREGGFRECEERCPSYVDLIGYENCQWVPSTEDACCTVPVCKQADESSVGHCLSDGKQFNLGDSWTEGKGCLAKKCRCSLEKNGTAEVICQGGCPLIPESALEPNVDCRSPKIVQPKDLCICPYVVCDKNINPLDLPEKSLKAGDKAYCEYKGDKIAIGKEFYDGCRAICMCEPGATLNCKNIQCSQNFGPHTTKCLEWDIDPHFVPVAPNCCPEPKCKNDGSCSFAGLRFNNHKRIPQELLPCGKRCLCHNGHIRCENMCPEVSDEPPIGLPCPPTMAFRGHLPGDKCCIHWQCRDVLHERSSGHCMYQEKRFKLGEHWDENETGIKRRCHCKMTNGIMHVACNPGNCQPITERYLESTIDCRTPTVVVPKDPIMCPYVICNNTKPDGSELDNVDIVAINATSARIRFTIPALYVGLLGHAEVHYTTDMNIPRNQWNIQKFARPKRMFDIPNIEYHLGNLKPDTNYFLQIEVIIEALKYGPTSEIVKLYQPPLPVTSSTTSTTTTTTLPPIIMLDMQLTGKALDATSIQLTWRAFSAQEGKFIDGIQIRYKKTDVEGEEWAYSPMLHRSTKQYVLDELNSGLTYAVDLIFHSVEGLSTNIVSSKPIVVELPVPPRDEFAFSVHIYPDDVAINEGQIDIELRDMPRPVSKYVNIAKLCYQNADNNELMYEYINIDETAKFSFSNLRSNTRYKVWIELYLKNGQLVTSNSIDIITKYNKPPRENDIGALTSSHLVESKYLLTFMVISVFVFVTGSAFLVAACFFLRKHSTAAISRVCISEAAYDNPTYKTFETADAKCREADSLSKSSTIPAK